MLITGRDLGGAHSVSISVNMTRVTHGQINAAVYSLVDKDRVREGSDSQVRVGVLIQIHVACQRVAKHPNT